MICSSLVQNDKGKLYNPGMFLPNLDMWAEQKLELEILGTQILVFSFDGGFESEEGRPSWRLLFRQSHHILESKGCAVHWMHQLGLDIPCLCRDCIFQRLRMKALLQLLEKDWLSSLSMVKLPTCWHSSRRKLLAGFLAILDREIPSPSASFLPSHFHLYQ